MHIGILTFSKPRFNKVANIDLLQEAAPELGYELTVFYESQFTFITKDSETIALYNGEPIPNIDVFIARPNFIEEPSLHQYVPSLLVKTGHRVINGLHRLEESKSKIAQHILMNEYGLPCPNYSIVRDGSQAAVAAEAFGYPVMAKVSFGSHGKGVFYAPDEKTLTPIIDYLTVRDRNPALIEEFIKEAESSDIRAFVIGGKVVGAMMRTAPEGHVRSNTSNGGSGVSLELTEEETALAIRAAEVFHLEIAGVDLIRSSRGPLILEVNSNPGFKTLQEVSGIPIAQKMLTFAAEQV